MTGWSSGWAWSCNLQEAGSNPAPVSNYPEDVMESVGIFVLLVVVIVFLGIFGKHDLANDRAREEFKVKEGETMEVVFKEYWKAIKTSFKK